MDIFDIQAARLLEGTNIDAEAFDLLHDPADAEKGARFTQLAFPKPEAEVSADIKGVGVVTAADIARCKDGLTLLAVAHAATTRCQGITKADAKARATIAKLALERLIEVLGG